MIRFLRKTHTYLYLGAVMLVFIPFYPFLYFLTRNPKKYYKQIVFCRKWISILATIVVGIRFKIEYEDKTSIDWSQPYVICPNHTSILDITALTYLCRQPFSFMGKIELLNNPVTKMFFKSIDIAVDRKSKISSFKAFKKADETLKNGKSIVIFPEGKIDDEFPPRLHEFKSGSFRLAIDNKVQILPVVIQDAWKILWDDGMKFGSRPGTVHIKILKPIDTETITQEEFDELQDYVYHKMNFHWKHSNTI
ncbi:lysophospholipid acyltransferase family protein [Sphingobacterium bovistauri]|uniref:1-acyl-sn-glycerol-3-phosphate acyltransferase n=1 Tax=Sphingobacterium bovistauri TaxID=2781959 RepID=A0ABS7Z350_9SPHI|nr:lysophospholipid acyltransferase family protein [Sphingobacterium bovistauri]MCA5004550.1 1-acyl-sn-glycerol-3-phosphate acyltransferase [Sphingobacterium bovistauri]